MRSSHGEDLDNSDYRRLWECLEIKSGFASKMEVT